MQRPFAGGGGDHHHHHTAGPPSSSSSGDVYNYHQPHYGGDQAFYDPNPYNYLHHHHNHYGHFNGGGGGGFGPGHHGTFPCRKRGWHNSNQDNVNYTKLYVAQVPRTATEQEIHPLFEQYGNVIEVVLLKDKNTGHQQGSCFVKYATPLEANNAVAALNNKYTFPGEIAPITVRYANANKERDRPGVIVQEKVFVANLNREAPKEEIEEIFSAYGVIEDIYIVRDEMKQSRGWGFIKFTQIEMARAAIEGLNGNFTMRGCDHPLTVRFAEPKKPRPGDFRSNGMYNGTNFGPDYQESGFRQTIYPGDPMFGYNQPNPMMHTVQHFSSPSQPQSASSVTNQEPPQFYQMPSQQMQNPDTSSQSSQQTIVPDLQKPDCPIPENQLQEQQSQTSGQQPPPTGISSQEVSGNSETPDGLESDWSEHTCPDGYKYYYNCVSCESLWDKPKEFASFKEELNKQRQQQNPCDQIQTPSPVLSPQNITQPLDVEEQNHVLHEELQLEKPSVSLPDQVEVQ